MRKNPASVIALGGVMAALAVVLMCMGGLIPVATFVCPMLCMMLLAFVLKSSGSQIAWAWYGTVAILGVLMGPDKEAVAVFIFLGYYPILKPRLDKMKLGLLLKLVLFNAVILLMYWLLINLFGMTQLAAEYEEMGMVLTAVTLILGNVTFFLLDKVLSMKFRK